MRFEQQASAYLPDSGYAQDGVASIAFDAVEECIWTGSLTGTLYQHLTPTLECYAGLDTLPRSPGPLLRLQSLGQSVAVLSAGQFGVYMSGCGSRACYLDERMNMSDMVYQHWSHRAIVGRTNDEYEVDVDVQPRSNEKKNLFVYDVVQSRVVSTYATPYPVALMASLASGQLALGSPTGDLMVFDPRQAQVSVSVSGTLSSSKIFPYGFAALESSGNLIATSGYGGLPERPALEPFVKVFDSRMGIKPLASIPFSNGPSLLRFHPTLRSTVLACSSGGMFSMVDTTGRTLESYFVDMGGDRVSACDFNLSGDCVVFGGASGGVALWASGGAERTATGLVPGYADEKRASGVWMDEFSSFSLAKNYAVELGMEGSGATAGWVGPEAVMSVGLPPRVAEVEVEVGHEAVGERKQVDFVTHLLNPKYDENNRPGESAAAVAGLRNRRIRHRRSGKEAEAAVHERARRREQMGEVVLPRKFCRVGIKQQKGTRFEEFDFKAYNATRFSGLENGIANCYMNPLIQVFYFCRPLRDCAMVHVPDAADEFSLLGEVSFLFQNLAAADGKVCLASNLLRALRQTPEAVALGLLEGVKGERGAVDIAVEAQKDKSLVRRIERLCRLLITRMDKEGTGVGDIFCLKQRQKTTCLSHPELPAKEQDILTFQLELKYPPPPPPPQSAPGEGHAKRDFASILSKSLETSTDLKAWFDETVAYQPVRQQRRPTTLPTVLVTYTGLEDASLVDVWNNFDEFPYAVSISYDDSAGGKTDVTTAADLVALKERTAAACPGAKREMYLLTGMLAYVYDKDEADEIGKSYEGHLIAHINVPGNYYTSSRAEGKSAGESESEGVGVGALAGAGNTSGDLGLLWMTFNDFSISPCALADIENTFDGQKRPILLFWTKVSYLEATKDKRLQDPTGVLSADAFLELCCAPPSNAKAGSPKRSFRPLSKAEVPKKGDLFALDAEFVSYSAPEKMVMSEQYEWSRTMRLGLGRVSLVRGGGPLWGTPCIDDYVRSVEPVYDHLTRYSGLMPGDLDVETSKRWLTTLRRAYLKLRWLVDQGVLFVGHGLEKDFRMLNLVVPADQIVDTMDLYYSGRGRRLSLKFLVAFFLGGSQGFQESVHDSIEDATAALRLFNLHEQLTRDGKFEELLARAYEWGLVNGWDPTSWASPPPQDWFS